ncbi:hypothetical protein [Streptomyces sp. 6N223]|uniref:hypothetical protein n=1 Tax=Streptomyces sp. 6N223 TaxID=3457412 RepID=UPI003FD45609
MVEAAWDAAYRGLTPPAARLYRGLAEHPTAHFPPGAAAAALGEGKDAADDALDELETAGLLEVRLDGHLHLPGPLRAHARRRAREHGDPASAGAAALRIVRWYRRQAERADRLAPPAARSDGPPLRFAEPVPALPYAPDVPLADAAAARRWLDQERPALCGCVRLAYEHGADADAWGLCEPLRPHGPGYAADVVEAFRTGVAAAGRDGHPAAQTRLRCLLARPLWELGRFEESRELVGRAVAAAEALGEAADGTLLASAVECRGSLRAAEGDWPGAAADFERSLALYRLHRAAAAGAGAARLREALENARRRGSAYGGARLRPELAGVAEAEDDAAAAPDDPRGAGGPER